MCVRDREQELVKRWHEEKKAQAEKAGPRETGQGQEIGSWYPYPMILNRRDGD